MHHRNSRKCRDETLGPSPRSLGQCAWSRNSPRSRQTAGSVVWSTRACPVCVGYARRENLKNMRAGARVLIVEDDRSIAGFVEPELERQSFIVRCAFDGIAGLEEAGAFSPDLIVLDIMLPRLDGVGVLKRLRQGGSRVPVIMLTARDATLDKVHSLDLGADDYLTKPFDIEELLARIRALLRRAEGDEILRVADLEINTSTREVRREEREIELTTRE